VLLIEGVGGLRVVLLCGGGITIVAEVLVNLPCLLKACYISTKFKKMRIMIFVKQINYTL
jgi:hypothetical protein